MLNNVGIEDLVEKLREYNPDAIPKVENAYKYAYLLHDGQLRKSGEPYITHPLNVAYILEEMHMDEDTICAAILHDTIEDTGITKHDIENTFNSDVAKLVNGVTKIGRLDFSSKSEQNLANTRKQLLGIITDVRIIIIKLADRLHNMRTMEFMKPEKQVENSMETLDIYVPLAYHIGAYRIKKELEDLSFKYIHPDEYHRIEELRWKIQVQNANIIDDMMKEIGDILNKNEIDNDIKLRIKNIYGIYQRYKQGYNISNIHDLIVLKVVVEEINDCYLSLGYIHSLYHPLNDKFKDYISNRKTNMYSSIHTTVFGEGGRLVQTQIRTKEMDRVASFGIAAKWDTLKGQANTITQKDLENYQFFKTLKEINQDYKDNAQFLRQVRNEIFNDNIYVYTPNGDTIELPFGSTPVDFAYKIHSDLGDKMIAAVVNNAPVKLDYVLKNQDRVTIITSNLSIGPAEEWINTVKTSYAKRKIKECLKKNTKN